MRKALLLQALQSWAVRGGVLAGLFQLLLAGRVQLCTSKGCKLPAEELLTVPLPKAWPGPCTHGSGVKTPVAMCRTGTCTAPLACVPH